MLGAKKKPANLRHFRNKCIVRERRKLRRPQKSKVGGETNSKKQSWGEGATNNRLMATFVLRVFFLSGLLTILARGCFLRIGVSSLLFKISESVLLIFFP